MSEATFTFKNGLTITAEQASGASLQFVRRLAMLESIANDGGEETDYQMANTVHAVSVTSAMVALLVQEAGGVPVNVCAFFPEEGGKRRAFKVAATGSSPAGSFDSDWGPVASAATAWALRNEGLKRGFRYAVTISTTHGGLEETTDASLAGAAVEGGPDESSDMLLRVTAFDLKGEHPTVRYWMKVAPTGVDDQPLHLIPWDAPLTTTKRDWKAYYEEQKDAGVVRLAGGIENLGDVRDPLQRQVDLRAGVYDETLTKLAAESNATAALALVEGIMDLSVQPSVLLDALTKCAPPSFMKALAGVGMAPEQDEPMGGVTTTSAGTLKA